MKRTGIVVILCLALSVVNAQRYEPDWSGKVYQVGRIYPGYYVTNTKDTVNGYFMHDDRKGNQKKCRFYTNEMDKKPSQEFKPEDIKSYKVGDKLYRTLNYSGGLLNKPLRFLLVTNDGGITEFVFYSEDGAQEAQGIFHKPQDPLHNDPITYAYFGLSFAKKLSDYISDYPALSQKVANKDKGYGLLNLLAIIDEYNVWFAAKKK
ncbi:MAG TPA: hypothetical protein VGO58_11405 [Chitinophagaceae bacterium]|jgi:hypothetical protein|nr:hypothetical protein [Chitinophagaceae bacterium]